MKLFLISMECRFPPPAQYPFWQVCGINNMTNAVARTQQPSPKGGCGACFQVQCTEGVRATLVPACLHHSSDTHVMHEVHKTEYVTLHTWSA